jgi:hypothetical protein
LSVELTLDKASLDHFNKQMDILKAKGNKTLYEAIIKVAMKIKTSAQLRLSGRKHVVTSRLKNSIYIKAIKEVKDNSKQYSDNEGKTFDADLTTVTVDEKTVAIGTNVEYGGKIENKDSYLYWALQNVDIEQSLAKDMKDIEKFSK